MKLLARLALVTALAVLGSLAVIPSAMAATPNTKISSLTTPVDKGKTVTLVATADAKSVCTLNGGQSKTISGGKVTWTWTATTVGTFNQTVKCTLKNKSGSASKSLVVKEPVAQTDPTKRLTNPSGYVALTFDDGPFCDQTADAAGHPRSGPGSLTPKLLDELKQYNVKTTFFVLGENNGQCASLVSREKAEGHQVGNHTWDHPDSWNTDAYYFLAELDWVQWQLTDDFGFTPNLWRPPYGHTWDWLNEQAAAKGLSLTKWALDSEDWNGPLPGAVGKSKAEVTASVVNNAKAGDIVLLHDWNQGTVDALPDIVAQLRAKGLEPGIVQPSSTPNAQNAGSYVTVVRG